MKSIFVVLVLALAFNQSQGRLMWAPRQFLDAIIYPSVTRNVPEVQEVEPQVISTAPQMMEPKSEGTGRVKVSPIGMFSYLLRLAEEQNRQQQQQHPKKF